MKASLPFNCGTTSANGLCLGLEGQHDDKDMAIQELESHAAPPAGGQEGK